MKKILLFGGTGFIGKELVKKLREEGAYIILATRNKGKVQKAAHLADEVIEYESLKERGIKDIDVIINLAGESILGFRWTKAKKERILNSRKEMLRRIKALFIEQDEKLPLLIQASATGFYGYKDSDTAVTEDSPAGEGFLAEVCKEIEKEAMSLEKYFCRIAIIRLGIVLGRGGFIKQILKGFRYGVGTSIGRGQQWFSWIHIEDVIGAIQFILEDEKLKGPINFTAPESIRFNRLMEGLSNLMKSKRMIVIPEGIIYLLLGEMADLLVKGIVVAPGKLMQEGYRYKYAEIEAALENIFK